MEAGLPLAGDQMMLLEVVTQLIFAREASRIGHWQRHCTIVHCRDTPTYSANYHLS